MSKNNFCGGIKKELSEEELKTNVPEEPTERMIKTGAYFMSYGITQEDNAVNIYKAMVKIHKNICPECALDDERHRMDCGFGKYLYLEERNK